MRDAVFSDDAPGSGIPRIGAMDYDDIPRGGARIWSDVPEFAREGGGARPI